MEIQKLILAEDVFDALEKGKICTIRTGRRDIQLGMLLFQSLEINREETVFVNVVLYCKLKNVPKKYLKNDGFKNHKDMEKQMKRFYPNINKNTEVTVINFKTKY